MVARNKREQQWMWQDDYISKEFVFYFIAFLIEEAN